MGRTKFFFARSSDRYSDNFEFGISESGNLDVYIDEKIDNVIKTFGNGELTVGQWHFFAIVFNQGQLTIYLEDRKYTGSLTGSSLNKATSPTPTYFAPHCIPTTHNTNGYYTLVNGGLVANHPTSLAISEAQISRQDNKRVLNTKDILVVSLGTGSLTSVYRYDEVKNWGLLQWGRPLLNIVLDGCSEVVAGELERLFESNHKDTKSYYRFQTFLNGDLEVIDNVKVENIRELQVIAHRLIAEKSQEIDELCSLLSN